MYSLFDHANLLKIRDFGVVPSSDRSPNAQDVVMLMPYYRAGTLGELLGHMREQGSFFTETEALALFVSICTGVRELHKNSPPYAHRDIKPANVLLNDNNVPVLIDFGSLREARIRVRSRQDALAVADEAAEHSAVAYRAPELFDVPSDGDLDERTDIWSLGCLLYAIAFGESPFESSSTDGGSVSLAVMSGRVQFPRLCPFSQAFCDLILFMLNTNPAARPFIGEVIERARAILREQLNPSSGLTSLQPSNSAAN